MKKIIIPKDYIGVEKFKELVDLADEKLDKVRKTLEIMQKGFDEIIKEFESFKNNNGKREIPDHDCPIAAGHGEDGCEVCAEYKSEDKLSDSDVIEANKELEWSRNKELQYD